MISRCQGSGQVCGLTFDDGPNGATTLRLLDFLGDHDIRAVFCLIGSTIREPGGADVVRRIARDGHLLANHSTNHQDMGSWSREAIRAELAETNLVIRDALGHPDTTVPYFRAPYGVWGDTESVAAELGMRSLVVDNTIDDWMSQDPSILASRLRAVMRPGALVLAHDGGGDREGTVDAVIRVVTERLADGWEFTLPASDEEVGALDG